MFLFYFNLGGWEKGNLGLELPCATQRKVKPQTESLAQRPANIDPSHTSAASQL